MTAREGVAVLISVITLLTGIAGTAEGLEYSSYIFTTEDIIFFSYQDGTAVEVYDSNAQLIWNNNGLPLDEGQHAIADANVSKGVYTVAGSIAV